MLASEERPASSNVRTKIAEAASKTDVQAPDAPDENTKKARRAEQQEQDRGRAKSPSVLLEESHQNTHKLLRDDKVELQATCARHESKIEHHHIQMRALHARIAQLEIAEDNSKSVASFATITNVVGGGVLGLASYFDASAVRWSLVSCGGAFLIASVCASLHIKYLIWPRKPIATDCSSAVAMNES